MSAATVTLYHYTSIERLPTIADRGYLEVTESNISRQRAHAGPPVVWLTTHADPATADNGLSGSAFDKTRVRITVEVEKRRVHKWRPWARSHGIDRKWEDALSRVGGSGSWRVSTERIPSTAWLEIRDMQTGRVLWTPEGQKREVPA